MPRWDVLPVELSRDSTWSPLWSFERPYIIVLYRKRDPSLLSGSIGYVPQVHEPTGLPYTHQNRRGIPSTHEVDFLWY